MAVEDMSNLQQQFSQMSNDELIDFALDHCGEGEALRQKRVAALMEYEHRTENDPNAIVLQPGEAPPFHNEQDVIAFIRRREQIAS